MRASDPRAVRSRRVMIDAAIRLFLRGGVEAVTHATVAVEAQVSRATIYRHWPRLTDLLLDALGDAALVVDFGEGDVRTQLLHEFGQRLPEINSPVAVAVAGVLVERGEHDARMQGLRDQIFGRIVDAVTAVIAAAAEDGQLAAATPAHELAVMIFGALLAERALLGRAVTRARLEQIVDAALQGWWRADEPSRSPQEVGVRPPKPREPVDTRLA